MLKLSGLAAELFEQIKTMPSIDCHEHLPTEKQRVDATVDVFTLFSHYCVADLVAAGMSEEVCKEVFDTSGPLMARWQTFKPYFEAIRFGSHAYAALAYVEEILGIEAIDESTIGEISSRLQADNKPGIYKKIIQDICGIETVIQCMWQVVEGDQPFFVYLCGERATNPNIGQFEKDMDRSIHTLKDYVDAVHQAIEVEKRKGAVGMKIGMAYERTLEVADVSSATAENVFVKLRAGTAPAVFADDMRQLEDYLIRRSVEACIDVDMPVVIHTGYQAGNRNDIRNSSALKLWSLLRSYPNARFDLYHGSFPYTADMTVLGKYFPNVALDMCYMHIVGPDRSRRALSEWLDAVPVTKIFAFGADYYVPEKIYGHLRLAQADVASVLAEKVERGRMTADEALHVARLLFYENPKGWYGL